MDSKPKEPSLSLVFCLDHQANPQRRGGSRWGPPDLSRTAEAAAGRAILDEQPLCVGTCRLCALILEESPGSRVLREEVLFAQSVCRCLRPAAPLDRVPSWLALRCPVLGGPRALCQIPSIRAPWGAPQSPAAKGSSSSPRA